ncbi:GntR family transcriptional regulator [Azospirillum doebereinerae]|uniref:GntR family transcriptional regulator n=1 Tax=Azospirillum doebereinerae TaxID=92933 RepID=A0A433J389_9PROT|nr:GntR family transcriptional regulator [Azospirillum doebereinerae]RUQ66180.1 GntR family transcriptional regulator [Azospirillum doebereinerae]
MIPSTAHAPSTVRRPPRTAQAAPRTPSRAATATASIYRELRADIVGMHRKPGEPIVERLIAETYGVSRTPVREALLRLADDGLVEIFPQSGTFVARIPLDALPEAIVIRTALEGAAVRYAAQRATGSQIAALRANLVLQRESEAAEDLNGFHEADERFHALIAEIAGFPGLWGFAQQVKVHVDRYRRLTLPEPGRIGHVIDEHAAVVDAIADRDATRAERCMAEHIDGLLTAIPHAQGSNPFFFTGSPVAKTL